MTACEACVCRRSCSRASPTIPAASRALVQNAQRSFVLNGPFPLSPGNTHSPDAVSARLCSSSRATPPSRTCLGPVFASIRASRSGLTSHQRKQRISPGLHPVSRSRRTAVTHAGFSSSFCSPWSDPSRSFRSRPAHRGRPRWGTPRTRRVTKPGSKMGRVGSAALKRRAGCKPLSLRDFRRFADARGKCDFLRPSARSCHTPRKHEAGIHDEINRAILPKRAIASGPSFSSRSETRSILLLSLLYIVCSPVCPGNESCRARRRGAQSPGILLSQFPYLMIHRHPAADARLTVWECCRI